MKQILLIFLLWHSVFAQTGGTFQIENSTIASGGGANSGGNFVLASTAGQTVVDSNLQGGRYAIQNGFWTHNLAPTAAQVAVGGRVLTANGHGIRNAVVMLIAPDGATRFTITGSFGYYRFDGVAVGETYIFTVFSKRFVFTNPTRIVNVNEELTDLDFIAAGQ